MPNYPAIYGIRAGMDYIRGIGVDAIDRHARPLTLHCLEELYKLPIDVLTPREPEHVAGIISFRHPNADRLHAYLHARGIHVMASAGRLRVAIHGYNTADEVEVLLRELKAGLKAI